MKLVEQNGVLDALPPDHDANFERIEVRQVGSNEFPSTVAINDVLQENAATQLQKSLETKIALAGGGEAGVRLAAAETAGDAHTKRRGDARRAAEGGRRGARRRRPYFRRAACSRVAGRNDQPAEEAPLDNEEMELIRLEHVAENASHTLTDKFSRSLAVLGMYVALYVLCGFYVYYREPRVADELSRLAILLTMVVLTVGA